VIFVCVVGVVGHITASILAFICVKKVLTLIWRLDVNKLVDKLAMELRARKRNNAALAKAEHAVLTRKVLEYLKKIRAEDAEMARQTKELAITGLINLVDKLARELRAGKRNNAALAKAEHAVLKRKAFEYLKEIRAEDAEIAKKISDL
jgi:hypothetical protein